MRKNDGKPTMSEATPDVRFLALVTEVEKSDPGILTALDAFDAATGSRFEKLSCNGRGLKVGLTAGW